MQNNIQIFENKELGKIRATEINGQPWFVGKDVANILGYKNAREAVREHVDGEDRMGEKYATPYILDGMGRIQYPIWINESGLYSLILSSKLKKAKQFKRWVTSEVLPSIRTHGAYITDDTLKRMREDSEYTTELIQKLSDEKTKNLSLQTYVEEIEPKAHYYDTILQCPHAVQASIVAADYAMSAIKFNKLLHALGVQRKVGKVWILYTCHEGKGYTISKTYKVNGHTAILTCFTQRGRMWLYELLKHYGIFPKAEVQSLVGRVW